MKNIIRRSIKIFMLLFLVAVATSLLAYAEYKVPAKQENVYVYDQESSLRDITAEKIEKISQQFEELTGIQLYIVTFENLETDNMESILTSKRVQAELKEAGKENILIFVSQSKNKIHLSASSVELQQLVWPILESFRKLINERTDYSSTVLNVAKQAIKLICKEKNTTFPGIYPEAVVTVNSGLIHEVDFNGLALGIGVPVAFIVVLGATVAVLVEDRKRR